MKKILGVILFFYTAIGCVAMASEKTTPSVRPHAVMNQRDTTQVLVISDRPGNVEYITTLGSKGSRAQVVFGSSRGRNGSAKPATWYTHRLPASISVEGISDLTPPGSFSGMADRSGNTIALNSTAYGQRNNPVLSSAALNALAHAPIGSKKTLSFREALSNGQLVQVSNDVTKVAQLTLSAPGRPFCQSGRVAGEDGYICRLRKIDVSSNVNNGGDIYFSLRTTLAMPKARYRIGAEWKKVNSFTPVASLANANYIEFFFVPPKKLDGMTLTGRILEMAFFSRSRQSIGDRIKLSVSGRELGLDKNGITAARLKLLQIQDKVSGSNYLTTQGGSARQRIFGTSDKALLWRLDQTGGKLESLATANPPSYFSTKMRSLSNGTLPLSAAGSAKLFSLALGQQQLLRAGGAYVDKSKFMFLTSAVMQTSMVLTSAGDGDSCRQITVENESGLGCTLRSYEVKGGIEGGPLQFSISGLIGAKFRVNTQWHAFNKTIPLAEFAKNGKIEVFIPQAKKGMAESTSLFKAEFYSSEDRARGDAFVVKLSRLSKKLNALRERKKQLGVMLINDTTTNAHFITTLTSNSVQSIYGDKTTARWYPLGRIKRAENVKGAEIEKLVSVKDIEPKAFFNTSMKNNENALFQGVPLSAQAWSTLDAAAVGQHFPFSYAMNAKGKEWQVTQEVTKEAVLQLDAPVNTSCQQTTVEGVKGTVCPLRVVTLNGTIQDNALNVAIRGGNKEARYRFNDSGWLKPEQYLPLQATKKQFGMLDVFTPLVSDSSLKKQTGASKLEFYNMSQRQSIFISLAVTTMDDTLFSTSLISSTSGVFSKYTSYKMSPWVGYYNFSHPTPAGTMLRPTYNNMNIAFGGDGVELGVAAESMATVTFYPSNKSLLLNITSTSNKITVPTYSTSLSISISPKLFSTSYTDIYSRKNAAVTFFNMLDEPDSSAPVEWNFLDESVPAGAEYSLLNLHNISLVQLPTKPLYLRYDDSHLGGDGNKYRINCGQLVGYSSIDVTKYEIYDGGNKLVSTQRLGTYSDYLQTEMDYTIKFFPSDIAKLGDAISLVCSATIVSGGSAMAAYYTDYFSSGNVYIYGVDSPLTIPSEVWGQQVIMLSGAEDKDINLHYKVESVDGGDVKELLSAVLVTNSYSGNDYHITGTEGTIPLERGRSNAFNVRLKAKDNAIGHVLKTTYWLDSKPDKVFTESIEIIEGLYLNETATTAPDTITYGMKGTWSFKFNRAVTAADSGTYSLKMALQHSTNSSSTAAIGWQVSPQISVKYLPGGVTETVNATNLVALSPPAGTTIIQATATSLAGNVVNTTLGMKAETLYLKGIDGVETTSSVSKSTKLINFGLTAVTDATAKEGESVTQTISYTESKTNDNAFYLRYQPAVGEMHPVDTDDYDLSNVTLLFSNGTSRLFDLSGTDISKIVVPRDTSSVNVSLPIKKDNENEWSDEKGVLQVSLADSFTDGMVEGVFTIANALAPSVFDIKLEALGGGTASGNFSDSAPLVIKMNLTRTENNAPKPDQDMDVKKYLERRMKDAVETTATLLGNNATTSGKTSCAFSLNDSPSITVPMRAQISYTNESGSSVVATQDCTGSAPLNVDEGEWILQSKDDETGIEERLLKLGIEFPLDDSFSAFNSEHKGWEGQVKGSGTVRVDIGFPAP